MTDWDYDHDWLSVVTGFERSLKRLEQMPVYTGDMDTNSWRRWAAGDPACMPGQDDHEWVEMVRAKTAAGATIERLRVVDDPMTPYQCWLIPASAEIVAAGETHRYVTELVASHLLGVHAGDGDWWLVDDSTLVSLTRDGQGKITTAPTFVEFARGVWNRAWGRENTLAR